MYTQIIFFLLISIGEMLVDEKVVGQNCENFKFTYEEGLNFKGERTFSNTNTGEFFRKSEIAMKSKWGNAFKNPTRKYSILMEKHIKKEITLFRSS